ncbi:MAG TPA: von Willebrand factor type A domain-containing protein, partial [Chitinophagaceae bacterium]|nr:von Willebrand factor type A domain-containing protein [Chitinophagaceae bacterium]
MKLAFYIAIFCFIAHAAGAQQYYIRGEVRDEGGNTLQNVSILQKSTGYVFYSGQSGSFGITSSRKQDSLIFSKDGFHKTRIWVDAQQTAQVVLKRLPVQSTRGYKLASMTQNLKRELQQQWFVGDETYASIIENQFIGAGSYPQTGLTLNVDRASYSNIRRFLNMNQVVPPDAVRIEELLNYFNLDYTEPPPGRTFAIQSVLTACPWKKENQLLFAQIHTKKIALDTLPPSHLVFLIDISGSMDMPNRLPLLKSGFRALVNNLRDKDSVSIVVYGGTTGVMLDATSGAEKEKIFKAIDDLTPGGSTPGESGVKLAYSVARNHFIRNGNNRVILATDGDFNVGLRTET